jgi:hypothetical protein
VMVGVAEGKKDKAEIAKALRRLTKAS